MEQSSSTTSPARSGSCPRTSCLACSRSRGPASCASARAKLCLCAIERKVELAQEFERLEKMSCCLLGVAVQKVARQ